MEKRQLLILPEIPSAFTGGGVLLREIIHFLAEQGMLSVLVPVMPHLTDAYEATKAGLPSAVNWHSLRPRADHGSKAYSIKRILSPLPGDVFAFATSENRSLFERLQAELNPSLVLFVSSWAAYPCVGQRLPEGSYLYMVNVDPDIIVSRSKTLLRRIEAKFEQWKVRRLMQRVVASAAKVGAITQKDATEIEDQCGRSAVEYLSPLMRPKPVDRSAVDPNLILITTNFTYVHNQHSLRWFLSEVWPLVDERANLWITGRDSQGSELELLARSTPRVHYRGCLPEKEFAECYEKAAVVVNPTLSGSGFQIKLLDAISRGVPVMSTAFSNPLGDDVPSSDNPRTLAELLSKMLINSTLKSFDYTTFWQRVHGQWTAFLG